MRHSGREAFSRICGVASTRSAAALTVTLSLWAMSAVPTSGLPTRALMTCLNRSEGLMPEARAAVPIRAEARFRLVRDHDKPVSHAFEEPYEFGLQDNKGEIVAGARDCMGRFVFDFSLKVKPAADGRSCVHRAICQRRARRSVRISLMAIDSTRRLHQSPESPPFIHRLGYHHRRSGLQRTLVR
jgi:hypothetical protein